MESLLTRVKQYTESDCKLPEPSYTVCKLFTAWATEWCKDSNDADTITWLTEHIVNLPNHDDTAPVGCKVEWHQQEDGDWLTSAVPVSKYEAYVNGDRGLDTGDLVLHEAYKSFDIHGAHAADRFIDAYKANGIAGINDVIRRDELSEDDVFTVLDESPLNELVEWYDTDMDPKDRYLLDGAVRFILCLQTALDKYVEDLDV